MNDTSLAFADAQIRALENSLLTKTQFDALIEAEDVKEILELLTSYGWTSTDNALDAQAVLAKQADQVWELVDPLLKNRPEHDLLTCQHDYHNIKVAIKSLLLSRQPQEYIKPTRLDLDTLLSVIGEKRFDDLPHPLREAAILAYERATRSGDGQQIDTVLDHAALVEYLRLGATCENEFCRKYATRTVDIADMKIAYRAGLAGKNLDFLTDALVYTETLNAALLAKAATAGPEELSDYLRSTPLAEFAEVLAESPTAFEKKCDDALIDLLTETKQIAFGVEPILAYYLAKENEIRNLRILLVCKKNGTSVETITERMRELYV